MKKITLILLLAFLSSSAEETCPATFTSFWDKFFLTQAQREEAKLAQLKAELARHIKNEQEQEEIREKVKKDFLECLENNKNAAKNADGIPCNCKNQEHNFIVKFGFQAYDGLINKKS